MLALDTPHPNATRGALDLERVLKWKFLLPILLLRKPPSSTGTKARDLKPLIKRQMVQCDSGDWSGLVRDYERDVVQAEVLHRVDERTPDEKDEAAVRKAADLLSRFQCSKARKYLQSNGLGDHQNPSIIDQMCRKHPQCKQSISPLSEGESQIPRKGINREVLEARL